MVISVECVVSMAAIYFLRKSIKSAYPILSSEFAAAASLIGAQIQSRPVSSVGQDDTTVSYLVNSYGLSSEAATAASHKVKLTSLKKPDSILALLRDYEFSGTQISNLVRGFPRILMADANKTLLPKLEFYRSLRGVSRPDFAKAVASNQSLLMRSLENTIIPIYEFLKSLGFTDAKVLYIFKNNSRIFVENLSGKVMPNIEVMRQIGMPQSSIATLFSCYATIITRKTALFTQLVDEVKQMGFDPRKSMFVEAMHALAGKETTWKRCEQAYKRWGWSEDDIVSAFKLRPKCMKCSEKKIMGTMDFLVNKMGWKSQAIAKHPRVFTYSLDKHIIPRCSAVNVLVLKGLIKEDVNLSTVVNTSEKKFLDQFVTRYLPQVPHLLNVYQRKVHFQDA